MVAVTTVPPPSGLCTSRVPSTPASRSRSPASPCPLPTWAPPHAVVAHHHPQHAVVGDPHDDPGGPGVLGRVGEGLGDDEVRRGLPCRGEPGAGRQGDVGLHGDRALARDGDDGGAQPAVDEHRRGDAAGQGAQLGEPELDVLQALGDEPLGGRGVALGEPALGRLQVHRHPHEPLLGTVVDVPLDPAQRLRLGAHDGGAAAGEAGDLLLELGDTRRPEGDAGPAVVQPHQPAHHPGGGEEEEDAADDVQRVLPGEPDAEQVGELVAVLGQGPLPQGVQGRGHAGGPPGGGEDEAEQGDGEVEDLEEQVEPALAVLEPVDHPAQEALAAADEPAHRGQRVARGGQPPPLDVTQGAGGGQAHRQDEDAEEEGDQRGRPDRDRRHEDDEADDGQRQAEQQVAALPGGPPVEPAVGRGGGAGRRGVGSGHLILQSWRRWGPPHGGSTGPADGPGRCSTGGAATGRS